MKGLTTKNQSNALMFDLGGGLKQFVKMLNEKALKQKTGDGDRWSKRVQLENRMSDHGRPFSQAVLKKSWDSWKTSCYYTALGKSMSSTRLRLAELIFKKKYFTKTRQEYTII